MRRFGLFFKCFGGKKFRSSTVRATISREMGVRRLRKRTVIGANYRDGCLGVDKLNLRIIILNTMDRPSFGDELFCRESARHSYKNRPEMDVVACDRAI